jgi:hypothetical protein
MIVAIVFTAIFLSGSIIGRPIGIVFFSLAAILSFTSVVSFCPTYLAFNVSTIKKRIKEKN